MRGYVSILCNLEASARIAEEVKILSILRAYTERFDPYKSFKLRVILLDFLKMMLPVSF